MRARKYRYFVCDFETTVYDGQDSTEVWASATVELFTDTVHICHSISEQLEHIRSIDGNLICYYHNLKFDGAFWLSYLMIDLSLKQAYVKLNEDGTAFKWLSDNEMPNNSFKYCVSDMGQWYTITLKIDNRIIQMRDSMKLLPFSVKKIGDSFGTKHKKLDMEYKGFRYAGCEITDEEREYIANDVLVVKEALEIMFNDGHNRMTIGSCCLAEYKRILKDMGIEWDSWFPDLSSIEIESESYAANNVDQYVRKSYRGGWCYVVKGKEKTIKYFGFTADVNSLYPSVMHSSSGNYYPVGKPIFWQGNYIPEQAKTRKFYYFLRVRTRFKLKEGYLPFIQVKGNALYKGTECLTTSDVYYRGEYYDYYYQGDELKPAILELTLTQTDWELIQEHYELYDTEIIDGCYFRAEIGIFDEYIDKYKKIKQESEGAVRESAKLFLNNLYGKMAASNNSSFKVAHLKPDGVIGFITIVEHEKETGYIPVGSAITSYARAFTIRAAQSNYYGVDKPGFIYADTDSIHCDLPLDQLKGVKIHETDFNSWKIECEWDFAFFTRQKTYIEHVVRENFKPPKKGVYYQVKCAGMPPKCKELFVQSINGWKESDHSKHTYTQDEVNFLKKKRTIKDFDIGLTVPGKLLPKRIKGGILLTETTYKMR